VRRLLLTTGALALAWAAGAPATADEHLVPNPNGALAGKTVVFSPGHGYLPENGRWRWQRGVTHDLREDIHTNEIFVAYAQRYLVNAGARVESVRERSFQTREVVVDDGDPGYSEAGSWTASTSAPDFYGSGYRYAAVDASGGASAEFRPDLPASGRYPVYAWWTASSNRSRDARFTVHHSGGATTVVVDMERTGDHWYFLGEFHFPAGRAGRVVLDSQGSDPSRFVIADAVRFGGGTGASGQPRWRESAKAFLPHKGFATGYGDVTVRPRYATWLAGGDTSAWRSDFVYVALHSNAGGGTGISTFSYSNGRTPSWGSAGPAHYPTSPSPLTAASDRLREVLRDEILAAVRADFDPSWRDRGGHRMNFGELREARNMPSALIELGFHDHAGDAILLRSARFRHAAARAIYKGLLRYLEGPSAVVVPLPPDRLRLENLGGGRLRASWAPVADPLEPSAAPDRYKVYVSPNGAGFDGGRVVSGTGVVLDGFAAGQEVYVRVAALNAGGESLGSRVGGARIGEPGRGALIVDGFDRAFRHDHQNWAGRYTYDYAREHLDALERTLPAGVPIDYAENEAVAGGAVNLDLYGLVDWLLGREGSIDRTFDPAEQAAVEAYLQAGGALLASGAEIGWDLEARGGGVRFLADALGATYAADDGGARAVRPTAGGPFAALTLLRFDGGRYVAASPDVFAPSAGAEALLDYDGSGTGVAAVGRPRRTCVLGFPLEAVGDPGDRADLTREALGFLAPSVSAGTPAKGGGSGSGGSSGGTAPVSSTTSPGATASPLPAGGGSSGGGCALAGGSRGGAPADALLLLLLALVARRTRPEAEPRA